MIAPTAVFLLETEHLSGILNAQDDELAVTWPEEPDEPAWRNTRIASKVKAQAAEMHRCLSVDGQSVFVNAVVVLWGRFDQEPTSGNCVTWTRGKDLVTTLTDLAAQSNRRIDVERVAERLREPALVERPRSVGSPH